MARESIVIQTKQRAERYEISIEHGGLSNCGAWSQACLDANAGKIAVISNAKVFGIYGETVRRSLEAAGFDVRVFLMKDGERFKSLSSLAQVLTFLSENNISRVDAVLALGGGVVGDLAGFAASIYLRGIPFLQMPTTLLSMIDSSVGGKTAVNTAFGKNLVGTFYQPKGVLIDVSALSSLPRRELTAGFCECVKQGALSRSGLLAKTRAVLENYQVKSFKKFFESDKFIVDLEDLVGAQVAFKADIVSGDEREDTSRADAKSRKILNFGHTLGHALEKVTKYRYFKHGEAVGYGILFAAELSKGLELCDNNSVNLLYDVVHRVGTLPDVANIDAREIFDAIKFDKKSTGKSIQWILLKGIGEPTILSDEDIQEKIKLKAFENILQR